MTGLSRLLKKSGAGHSALGLTTWLLAGCKAIAVIAALIKNRKGSKKLVLAKLRSKRDGMAVS